MSNSLRFFRATILLFSVVVFSSVVLGQPVEIPFHVESYRLESGSFDGGRVKGEEAVNVFTGTVELNAVPWIQLFFGEANLGANSYLIITSLHDGYWQKLDAVSIEQWNYYSAFFNGGVVEIALYVAPYDNDIFFQVDEVVVGDWVNGFPVESQCGPTDDRISSDQLATSRLMNIGCTAWIIPNGHFVSAGHCLDGSNSTYVEFQVPPSLPGGTVQHPGPEDQYSVDVSTKVYTNGGIGNDWGTFEVFPNSITGLMPKEAQGAYWPLKQDLGPDSIRITGYGVDSGVDNQTQQTHVGPNAGSSGNTMRYRTDTEGGNSGSPVIDELTGYAVGVHTHGGCNVSGGNNNGTSLFHTAFWDAVEQGAGGCPVEPASNPNPVHGASSVPLNLSELTWTNGAGAVSNELYFGTSPSSMTLMQSGSLATSWTITGVTLVYGTDYFWQVVEIGDTCNTPGSVWSFKTVLDPLLVIDSVYVYPQSAAYWTGTTDGATKTDDSEVRCLNTEDGWMMFDVSPIPNDATVTQVTFYGYVNLTNWPYWSATPLPGLNPITATAAELKAVIEANSAQGTAYVWSNESSTFAPGWHNYLCETWTNADLQAALVQDWFAMGMDSRDNSATYYINWDGWNQPNVPYLSVVYEYIVPVELTSFFANVNDFNITLNWSTATETNNSGFEVQRSESGEYETITFINGNGTTTEPQAYSFTDEKVSVGSYTYRLKQIDFDGTFEYSNVIEVDVGAPSNFVLEQNYPNPFNPSTTIKFALPIKAEVQISVYNMLGEKVAEVFNGSLEEGYHEVVFDATSLTSGTYFYRLEANDFVDVKKMIILK
jgi:V8-like Glu-specific endopeptidase